MAAADPANPYGAALGWPENASGRAARRAGAHVILHDGRLVAYVERGGKSIVTYPGPDDIASLVAAGLADLASRRYRRMTVGSVDGEPITGTDLAAALLNAGFTPGYKGLTFQARTRTGSSRARR